MSSRGRSGGALIRPQHRNLILNKNHNCNAKSFIKQHEWPIDIVVGYHQVRNRKPHPEGLLLAMARAAASPDGTIHIGDQPEDTEASRAAGVTAIGSAWGIDDAAALEASKPDRIFRSVDKLERFLLQNL